MAANNVISFEQSASDMRRRVIDAKTRELIAGCRLLVRDALPRLMQDLFEKLDDELYALADKSASDALETEYFVAMRELRKLRQPIEQRFAAEVLDKFDRFWSHGYLADAPTDDEQELSLLEEETLEEDLAIAGLVSKAENRFHRELFALTLRFGHMFGEKDLAIEHNPLAPQVFGDGFRQAISRWDGELRMRLLIYKLFEQHVMAYVGGVYDDLNQTLIDRGVLPKIINRFRRNPVAPSIQRARSDGESTQPVAETLPPDRREGPMLVADTGGDGGAGQAEIIGLLSQLVQQQRRAQLPVQFASLPTVPATEVIGALDGLQLASAAGAAANLEEAQLMRANLVELLHKRLDMGVGGQASRRFGDNHQDLIDVISMMFELVLEDRNLPDPMKVLLSRLQIPILKVALLDRGFFADKNHPARQLLNNLAQAAMGWNDDEDRSETSVYTRIESAVDRVLTEFKDDIDLFESINDEFMSFVEQEQRQAEVAENRFTQVTQGQEQLAVARNRVNEVLFSLLRRYPTVTRSARELLMEAWKDVLLLSYLREGEDGKSWRNGLEVADRLLWSVLPKEDENERQRLLKAIPELLKVLRDSLANISFDQHKANRMFKDLQASHIAALRGDPPAADDIVELGPEEELREPEAAAPADVAARTTDAADEAATTDTGTDTDADGPVPEAVDVDQQRAANMAVGDWLEWHDDGKVVRGKLCWKSRVSGTYVFVNRRGQKLADFNVSGVAAMLRAGTARLIEKDGSPLVDRLLGTMVETLKDQPPEPAAD